MDRAPEAVEESSVPRLFSTLYRRGFTGRADVFENKGKSSAFYRRGRVVKVQRADGLDRLGEVLVQGRLAAKEAVAEVMRLYGESEEEVAAALARHPAVGPDTVRAGIRLQLSRQLARAFFSERPRFEVAAGEHRFRGAESPVGGEVDPRIVIYPGIRAAYDEARLGRELASFVGARVRVLPVSPDFLREAGFRQQDEATIKALTGAGIELNEGWLKAAADPRGSAPKAVVLALHCLDLLDVQRESVPIDPVAAEGPRRRTGVTGLNSLDPATVARMAEAFFKNGDTSRAERAFAMALKSDPQNRRAQAFSAWLEFWKPSTDRPVALPDALKKMKEAVRSDNQFAYGYYFLGSLQKLANEPDAATRSFRAALEADAGMMEAQRELRLLTMRKGGRGSIKTA
jgi:tetratricopeptide (TPR) repeat protein